MNQCPLSRDGDSGELRRCYYAVIASVTPADLTARARVPDSVRAAAFSAVSTHSHNTWPLTTPCRRLGRGARRSRV